MYLPGGVWERHMAFKLLYAGEGALANNEEMQRHFRHMQWLQRAWLAPGAMKSEDHNDKVKTETDARLCRASNAC